MPKQERVVITGAAGFIGSNLCRRFLDEGVAVIGIDNFSSGYKPNLTPLLKSPKFQFIEADVCDAAKWAGAATPLIEANGIVLFHLASPASPSAFQRYSLETIRVNTIGLENCLTFADSFQGRVIFSSTSEVYGSAKVHPQPEGYWGNVNPVGPRACYDEAKRLGESLIYSWNQRFGTKHGMVRIFNAYGPGMNPDDGRVMIRFLKQAFSESREITVYGDGTQTRTFCYIDDLLEGLIRYANSGVTEPVNLGSRHEISVLQLFEILQTIFPDRKLKTKFCAAPPEDPKKRCPDLSKAMQLLNWEPKIDLWQGIRLYADHLRALD